ncbi:MAG: hypothetical protein JSV50_09660 [Desulfobacteraceae bacterium]|nr:MAG: hypothetical protein JSV50_09660 [Desulfobacteraceae bacterium]
MKPIKSPGRRHQRIFFVFLEFLPHQGRGFGWGIPTPSKPLPLREEDIIFLDGYWLTEAIVVPREKMRRTTAKHLNIKDINEEWGVLCSSPRKIVCQHFLQIVKRG